MKKFIPFLLILALAITSFASIPLFNEENHAYADEQSSSPTKYHLDIGVYVVAKTEGKWVNGVQYGSVQPYKANLTFASNIKVSRVMSLAQAQNEGINIWKEKYFTHNMPSKSGEAPRDTYGRLYEQYVSPSMTNYNLTSNKENNVQFTAKVQLNTQSGVPYNLIEKYKDRVDKTQTVQQIVVKDNKTATAMKNLMAEKDSLYKVVSKISSSGATDKQMKAYKRYNQVLKQIKALNAKPNYTTIDKVIESYKFDEKGFIDEVYKFWGGSEGLKAVNVNMYGMMKNMEKGNIDLSDEYYLVFTPSVIEYKVTGKTCSICGKCVLDSNSPVDHCTKDNCKHFGTPECGCYKDPGPQITLPEDTTGSCTDVITWKEVKSHTYHCGGENCKGHTCRHVYIYQAKLESKASLKAAKPNGNDKTFKSGYGFMVDLSNVIEVKQIGNAGACRKSLSKVSDKKVVPPTLAEVRTNWTVKNKEKKSIQGTTITMAKGSASATTSQFVTTANPVSNYNKPLIYTDVALKGTRKNPVNHTITVYTYGGGVNGVQFCKSIPLTFTINGNMYEDDWTVNAS